MRYIKYLFMAVIALALVLLALANRDPVTLTVLPPDLAAWVGWNYERQLPVFLVILGGVVGGLLIGFIWEWFREHRQRSEARAQRAERDRLAREVETLRGRANAGKDDVLALIKD